MNQNQMAGRMGLTETKQDSYLSEHAGTKKTQLNSNQLSQLIASLELISLAKNIKLMEKTLSAYEMLLAEDLANDVFLFDDFIGAIRQVIGEKLFNRIDYADFASIAKNRHFRRGIAATRQSMKEADAAFIADEYRYKKKIEDDRDSGRISLNEMIARYPNDESLKNLRNVLERNEKKYGKR